MEIDSNRLPEGPLPRRLADRYMSIVRRHAYRLARRLPSHVHVEDLMGAGFVGLADALVPASNFRLLAAERAEWLIARLAVDSGHRPARRR